MDTPVLVAVVGPREPDIVRALSAAPGLLVERRCGDVTELLAVAAAGRGSLAVVSASHLGIDREVVDRLHRDGVAVLALASPEDTGRVGALGPDAVLESGAAPDEVVAALRQLAQRAVPPPPPSAEPSGEGEEGSDRGRLVAVWGTHGAPGRTALAASLASLLPGRVLLVDADTRAPSLAQSLGIIEDTSGIAAACRAASNGRLDSTALARAARIMDGVAILTGLTRPDRWREVPASALDIVLDQARADFAWTVVDVAGGWEEDASDPFGPARDGAREAVLRAADVVLVVGAADPVGVWRLVELLSVKPRVPGREVVVVNRVRASVTGPQPQASVREALSRFAGVGEAILVPADGTLFDGALLRGEFPPRAGADSMVHGALAELCGAVTGEPVRRRTVRGSGGRPRRRPW